MAGANEELTLAEFILILKELDRDRKLEVQRIISDVLQVVLLMTIKEVEKQYQIPSGKINSMEDLMKEFSAPEQKLEIIKILADVESKVKNDYIMTQVAALNRKDRLMLMEKYPKLNKYMESPMRFNG